jgi:hypothetical protein
MNKNKYDLVEDIAWMLVGIETCKGCFMKDECLKFSDKHGEKVLCGNVTELTQAIEKKYLTWTSDT